MRLKFLLGLLHTVHYNAEITMLERVKFVGILQISRNDAESLSPDCKPHSVSHSVGQSLSLDVNGLSSSRSSF